MELFGFEFSKKAKKKEVEELISFVPPTDQDGTSVIATSGGGAGYYGQYVDIDGNQITNEKELIMKYRTAAAQPDCDSAIMDIVNAAIVSDDDSAPVNLIMDDLDLTEGIKKKINTEFEEVVSVLGFNEFGHEYFRRWYIDGRLYFHVIVDPAKQKEGIAEVREIDPTKIRKVREVTTKIDKASGIKTISTTAEYFQYLDTVGGVSTHGSTDVKIDVNSVIYVPSGLLDESRKTVISHLHKALKGVNNLRMMEDSLVIYRMARAPERRIFYIDVGNLPKGKAEEYVQGIMSKYRNKLVYDNTSGEIKDERKSMCLTMDTRIPLLDGRTLSLAEITDEYNSGKTLWVYSCDPITGKFAPGLISWAGVTRKDAEVMKLTLDNGKTITCTPDHKFPVWNKGFVRADELTIGESMIPHYTREKAIIEGKSKYHQLFDNESKTWKFTHRLVSEWKDNNEIPNEWTYDELFLNKKKGTVHHINFNRYNNDPENLARMNGQDHILFHKQNNSMAGKIGGARTRDLSLGYFNKEHPEYHNWKVKAGMAGGAASAESGASLQNYAKGREVLSELIAEPDWNEWFREQQRAGWTEENKSIASNHAKRNDLSSRGNEAKKLAFKDKNSDISKKHAKLYKTEYTKNIIDTVILCAQQKMSVKTVVEYLNSREDLTEEFAVVNSKKVMSQKDYTKFNKSDPDRMAQQMELAGYSKLKAAMTFRNHKIVSIEYLDERIDTGCLTVDGDEIYHNHHTFALDAGIYTKNSMLEDFWLPRKEGGRGTEISTLPGGESLGQLDDVLYFKKNLYRALNVPISRLESETGFNIGRASEISRDEVKFHKFITRLRQKFSYLLLDLLKIQLLLKGIITEEDWDNIKENVSVDYAEDNYFSELKDFEILKERLSMLSEIQPHIGKYYSNKWVRANILRQTEQDIERIDDEIAEEEPVEPEGGDDEVDVDGGEPGDQPDVEEQI